MRGTKDVAALGAAINGSKKAGAAFIETKPYVKHGKGKGPKNQRQARKLARQNPHSKKHQ